MGGIRPIEWIFYFLVLFFIFASIFFSLPIGDNGIGISSETLAIGDRSFYINDLDPFGDKGYQNYGRDGISFSGGILYPKILEIASFVSEKIFNQSTTSTLWNTIVISFAAICSLITHKLLFLIGRLVGGEQTGIVCIIIYTICPYTYFYILSGDITNYSLLFTTLATYCFIKIIKSQKSDSLLKSRNELVFLFISLLSLSLLRPSSAIFSLVISFGIPTVIFLQDKINASLKMGFSKSLKNILILISVSIAIISINQLLETRDYSIINIKKSLIYGGSFFGYPRELLREKILTISASGNLIDYFKSLIYRFIFMTTDFYAGINDLRDSFSAANQERILPFLLRVSIGVFFFTPLTTLSIFGIFTFRKQIIDTGLFLPLCASFAAISTSFFGCSLSRYYFMFITPFIVSCALLLVAMKSISKKNIMFSNFE
tara:strand:- start:813 stop:2105 length:1293 start_codon:yes stop_codon:yes gene_type:complete